MFGNYIATEEDLKTIKNAIDYVWSPKMDFVFQDRSKIRDLKIVSYDSRFIYIWIIEESKNTKFEKVPHKLKIKDELQDHWVAGSASLEIEKYLSDNYKSISIEPKISGGLLTPFIELQKKRTNKYNPYVTKESYLATIMHEFGHIYWNSYRLWWFSNKKRNLRYLGAALKLYKQQKISISEIVFPTSIATSELFAFCTEYCAASLFWPKYKNKLDKYVLFTIRCLIGKEEKKDLSCEDSTIEPGSNPHYFSFVFGKIILEKYPTTWPALLMQNSKVN